MRLARLLIIFTLSPAVLLAVFGRFDRAVDGIPWQATPAEAKKKINHPGLDSGAQNEWRLAYIDQFYGRYSVISYYFAEGKLNEVYFDFPEEDLRGVYKSVAHDLRFKYNGPGDVDADGSRRGSFVEKHRTHLWSRPRMKVKLEYCWLEDNQGRRSAERLTLLFSR